MEVFLLFVNVHVPFTAKGTVLVTLHWHQLLTIKGANQGFGGLDRYKKFAIMLCFSYWIVEIGTLMVR